MPPYAADAHKALRDFFVERFNVSELRILLNDLGRRSPGLVQVLVGLRWQGPLEALADEVVCMLEKRRAIDARLFAALTEQRPRLEEQITEIARLYAGVRGHRGEPTIPSHIGPFVGRSGELQQLLHDLGREDVRIVTVLGPPGIGKTSLAIQASLDLNDRDPPPGGIWWVMLRDAVTRREVLRVLTEALPALVDPSRAERHADDIGAWLSRQPPMLLVLDHADTCAAPLAELLMGWLMAAPDLRVMCTSISELEGLTARELNLRGLVLEEAREAFKAIALLDDEVSPADLPDEMVLTLVERLDGYPMAIQVLAAQVPARSVGELLELVDEAPVGDALDRALGAAWALLSPSERDCLDRVAVFPNGFFKEVGLRAVGAAVGASRGDMVCVAAARSLLNHTPAKGLMGVGRHFMLAPVRSYALARLEEDGQREEATRAAVAATLSFARGWMASLYTESWREAHLRLVCEEENLEEMIRMGTPEEGAEAALAIDAVSSLAGAFHRSVEVVSMALERADALAPATRLRLLLARAAALLSGSLWTEAAPDLEAARAVAQAGGEVPSELRVESARLGAVLARRQGRLDEAERQIAEARAGLDASVPAAARGELGVAEGDVAVAEGDLIRGVGLFDEAVRLFDGVGNQLAAAHARRHLAVYLLALGRHEDALVHLEQALHVTLDLGAAPAEAALRQSLGHLCLDLGRAAEAEGHFDAAAAIFEQLKAPGKVGEIWVARGVLQLDRGLPEQEVSGFEEARRWLEQASSWRFLVVLAVNEVLTALSFGRPDAARRALTSLAARGVTPDPRTAAYLGAVEAVVLAWEGEIARALAQIAEAQQVLPGQMHAVNHEVLRTLHACVLALGARGGAAEPDALAAARARERDVGEGGALSNLLARSSDLRITARILRQLLAGVEVQGPEMGALAGDGPALAASEAPAAAPG